MNKRIGMKLLSANQFISNLMGDGCEVLTLDPDDQYGLSTFLSHPGGNKVSENLTFLEVEAWVDGLLYGLGIANQYRRKRDNNEELDPLLVADMMRRVSALETKVREIEARNVK